MVEQPYLREADLQDYLEACPELLSAEAPEPERRRWLLVKREMGVADREGASDRFGLDHLFVDQDAIPTFVEVKRSSDTRLRREVVGQMLDYAANASAYWDAGRLRGSFQSRFEDGEAADAELSDFVEGDYEHEDRGSDRALGQRRFAPAGDAAVNAQGDRVKGIGGVHIWT